MSKRESRSNNAGNALGLNSVNLANAVDEATHDGAELEPLVAQLIADMNNNPQGRDLSSRDDNLSIVPKYGFTLTRYGLKFEDGVGVSLDLAKQFAEELKKIESSIQWIYGDLLDRALTTLGVDPDKESDDENSLDKVTYEEISIITGYTQGTLRNFVGIARRFKDHELRAEMPSFKHYQILYLNGITGKKIRTLIDQVKTMQWSTAQLSHYIKYAEIPPPPKKGISKLIQTYEIQRMKFEKDFEKADAKKQARLLEIAERQAKEWIKLRSRLGGEDS